MPTLNEFIVEVLQENNIDSDPALIEKFVEDEAERLHEEKGENIVAISDEDVRNIVINFETLAAERKAELEKQVEEKKQKELEKSLKEAAELEEKQKKQQEIEEKKEAKRLAKLQAGEQQSLF